MSRRCFLEGVHNVGIRRVRLAAVAELHVAGVLELGALTAREHLALELCEADTADRARRSRQAAVDDVAGEPDRFKQLRAAVRRDFGDAHLGHDLEDAVLDRFAEAQLCLRRRRMVAAELVLRGEAGNRLERETWTDRVGAVAQQTREVVRLTRLVADDHEGRARSHAGSDESLVHCASCEHCGNGSTVRAVVEHEHLRLRRKRLLREPCTCGSQSFALVERRIENSATLRQVGRRGREEEEAVELEQARRPWMLSEERRPRAKQRAQ